MPIGVPKVPFRSPGEEDASWVDVKCGLSDILGHMGFFPVFSPDRDIPRFAQERFGESLEICSMKFN